MQIIAAAVIVAVVLFMANEKKSRKRSKAEFFTLLRPVARAVESETGIKADIGMLQAAHESAFGNSGLTKKANNLFGFTAELGTYWRTRKLPFVLMPTSEYLKGKWVRVERPFRAYTSWEDSYRDWARLMQTRRYPEALAAARAGNLNAFAEALYRAGYATDPGYAAKLQGLARSTGLA